jgi:hypothetical protein
VTYQNILKSWPELEALRDRLLVVDPEARKLGKERLTLLLFSARTALPVPPDRLLATPSAAAMAGLPEDEFVQLMADFEMAPARVTGRGHYYRSGDVQRALEKLRAVNA